MLGCFCSAAAAADRPTPQKKDPVQMAFALPPGMVLTSEEFKYASQVRVRLEPRLRDALRRVQESPEKSDKLKAAKEVREIKAEVQAAIGSILQARYVKAVKAAAAREAAKRKAAAKKRSRGGKKGKRGRRR